MVSGLKAVLQRSSSLRGRANKLRQSITGTVRRAAQFTSNLACCSSSPAAAALNTTVNGMSYGQSEKITSRALRVPCSVTRRRRQEMVADEPPWKTESGQEEMLQLFGRHQARSGGRLLESV